MKPRTLLVFVSLLAVSLCAKANPLRKYIDELQSNKLSDYATVVLLDSTSVSFAYRPRRIFCSKRCKSSKFKRSDGQPYS